jgi:tetratricopeptide (TPR) repeat protein
MVTSAGLAFVTACEASGPRVAFNHCIPAARPGGPHGPARRHATDRREASTLNPTCCVPRTAALAALAAVLLLGAPHASGATPEELADFDAKAEYAFFTEDARALAALVAANAALGASAQPLERYQYAHAEFRRLQVAYHQRRTKDVEAAAGACLAAVEKANETDPRFAEGLALEAACAGYLGSLGGLRGASAQRRSEARLAAAAELAPRSPRVLLVAGMTRWFRHNASAADHAAAREAFEGATRAFETVTASDPGQPSWGEADAWLFVGRALEESGDLLGARNAYEKSLLIAPEFAAARRRVAALRGQP